MRGTYSSVRGKYVLRSILEDIMKRPKITEKIYHALWAQTKGIEVMADRKVAYMELFKGYMNGTVKVTA
jgi:hypothetical protein